MSTSVQVIPYPKGDAAFDPATGQFTFGIDVLVTGTGVTPKLNGWIVQKMTIDWKVYKCDGCDCATGRRTRNPREPCESYLTDRLVYLEAWQVVNGRVYHGKASDNDPQPQDTFRTGTWDTDPKTGKPIKVCGTITMTGEFKFFRASHLDPALDPDDWTMPARQAGLLPSTRSKKSIDAFGPTPKVPPSREHVLEVTFGNCAPPAFVGRVVRQSPTTP